MNNEDEPSNTLSVETHTSVIPIYSPSAPVTSAHTYGAIDSNEVNDLERGIVESPCACPPGNPLGEFCKPVSDILINLYYHYPKTFALILLVLLIGVLGYSVDTGNYLDVKWLFCIFLGYCGKIIDESNMN